MNDEKIMLISYLIETLKKAKEELGDLPIGIYHVTPEPFGLDARFKPFLGLTKENGRILIVCSDRETEDEIRQEIYGDTDLTYEDDHVKVHKGKGLRKLQKKN